MEADRLLVLCRPGFERDVAAELTQRCADADAWGHARTRDGEGIVEFVPADDPFELLAEPAFADRVFPRQLCAVGELIDDLPVGDRVGALLEGVRGSFGGVVVETADGDAHRPLSRLARQLRGPVLRGLEQRRCRVNVAGAPRLHIVLDATDRAWVGRAPAGRSSALPGGVLRLRADRRAPSRSALKLEEAIAVFLDEEDALLHLDGRATAADLGAAPGGWTWVLRRRGVRVHAIDNGELAPGLAVDPGVDHQRADAFTWRPPSRLDWVVCDVVDKPARVVELLARWVRKGWASRALFNLKLPMKQRWRAVVDARQRLERALGPEAGAWALDLRQLCHDREEVTGYLRRREDG